MDEFLKNYIPWDFDRELTKSQKIRRKNDLQKYILQLFEKMYCFLIPKNQWEKLVDKFFILLLEFRDLIIHLNFDEDIVFEFLENEFEKVKEKNGYCIKCIDEVNEDEVCICIKCIICGRIELCYC